MKILEDSAISAGTHEFVIEFVLFGSLTRPALRRTVLVRAANQQDAKKILRKKYPRSDQYAVKRQAEVTFEFG